MFVATLLFTLPIRGMPRCSNTLELHAAFRRPRYAASRRADGLFTQSLMGMPTADSGTPNVLKTPQYHGVEAMARGVRVAAAISINGGKNVGSKLRV